MVVGFRLGRVVGFGVEVMGEVNFELCLGLSLLRLLLLFDLGG